MAATSEDKKSDDKKQEQKSRYRTLEKKQGQLERQAEPRYRVQRKQEQLEWQAAPRYRALKSRVGHHYDSLTALMQTLQHGTCTSSTHM